ncbi:NAD(P)H-binding protein [Arcticibacter sp. MXS-1]|uniref:NAD(P)H-binding protein n=1 Tax=Arcticibacter sp. MXS-1 TaxID=3341726 RepID=UPI0035A862B0
MTALKRVIIAGASGLIGSHLLQLLLSEDDIDVVVALVRRPLPFSHSKLQQITISFEEIASHKEMIRADAVFCCLGSTRKKTPDLNDYRRVDYVYPLELAKLAAENGVNQYHLVSALGSDVRSSNTYARLKGEVEQDIKNLSIRSLHIYKPSLLVGKRSEKRPLEKLAIHLMNLLNPFLMGSLKKYRSIKAETVARAMLNQYKRNRNGVYSYPSDQIKALA